MRKILQTIHTSILLVGFIAFLMTGCVDEKIANTGEVVEGVPITVTMNLSATSATDVIVNTRADDNLSTLVNLVILVFHDNGRFEHYVSSQVTDENSKLIFNKTTTEGLYSVSFKTTSGKKKLIVIANTPINEGNGGFWELSEIDIDELQNYTFTELKDKIIKLRKELYSETVMQRPIQIVSSSQMLMTGWNEDLEFGEDENIRKYGVNGDANKNVIAKLDRTMARITFNIKKGNGNFIPSSYRIYNIPVESGLIKNNKPEQITYVYTESTNIGSVANDKYTFEFYSPENIQEVKVKPEGTDLVYNDREKWDGEKHTAAKDKQWTYAQKGTFVVISGTYSGTANIVDENGNVVSSGDNVTGNVEYTIHLGDFSDETGSFGNFSVERNTAYTYNVEVIGVNNIIVEAITDKENQSGAEGELFTYDSSTYSYELDAHYEQVFLEYNLSNIAQSISPNLATEELENAIADNLILIIQSEAMDYNHPTATVGEPYTVLNKRGTLKPYQIYANTVRNLDGIEAEKAANAMKYKVLNGNRDESLKPQKGFDYKWVEFWPQSGSEIAKYPGVSAWSRETLEKENFVNPNAAYGEIALPDTTHLKDVYDVIVAMGKVIKKIYKGKQPSTNAYAEDGITITKINDKYVARFTAFVNEYYYYKHPLTGAKVTNWSVFTNKMPREMIIAMSSNVSKDGNSSFSTIYSYISQLSMQTFYNSRTLQMNGFGIETYNETPHIRFGGSVTTGLSDTNGRSNQIKLIGGLTKEKQWESYIIFSQNGWTGSIGSDRINHKLPVSVYEGTSEESDGDNGGGAYFACLSRNRDLNGNGVIDENEVRWYLPSINEYIRIGIGSNALSNAAQLYMGDKYTMVHKGYATSYIWDGSLYFTSSNQDDKRVYWAVERGSYGVDNANYTGNGAAKPIRCIRSLPSTSNDYDISTPFVESDPSFIYHENTSPQSIEFKDRLVANLYRQRVDGSLGVHNEDNPANSFSQGIFVADKYLEGTYRLGDIIGYKGTVTVNENGLQKVYTFDGTMLNPCEDEKYSEGGYSDWRVPNLVELSAMNAAGLLDECYSNKSGSFIAACCTQFSNLNVRFGFARSSLIYCPGGGEYGSENPNYSDLTSKTFRIRCVRDVPDGYTFGQ